MGQRKQPRHAASVAGGQPPPGAAAGRGTGRGSPPTATTGELPPPSSSFPIVTLLQIACHFRRHPEAPPASAVDSPIFLLDLLSIPLDSVWELLRDVFVDPNVLKLGFKFKQDLIYLSGTFASAGCPGFDRIRQRRKVLRGVTSTWLQD